MVLLLLCQPTAVTPFYCTSSSCLYVAYTVLLLLLLSSCCATVTTQPLPSFTEQLRDMPIGGSVQVMGPFGECTRLRGGRLALRGGMYRYYFDARYSSATVVSGCIPCLVAAQS
jgi:hypothetical protein